MMTGTFNMAAFKPGVSMTLTRKDLPLESGNTKVIGVLLMDISRSCSVNNISAWLRMTSNIYYSHIKQTSISDWTLCSGGIPSNLVGLFY